MLTGWINDPPEELYVEMFADAGQVSAETMKIAIQPAAAGYSCLDC